MRTIDILFLAAILLHISAVCMQHQHTHDRWFLLLLLCLQQQQEEEQAAAQVGTSSQQAVLAVLAPVWQCSMLSNSWYAVA